MIREGGRRGGESAEVFDVGQQGGELGTDTERCGVICQQSYVSVATSKVQHCRRGTRSCLPVKRIAGAGAEHCRYA